MKNAFGIIFAFMLLTSTAFAKVTCPVPDPPKPTPTQTQYQQAIATAGAQATSLSSASTGAITVHGSTVSNTGNNTGTASVNVITPRNALPAPEIIPMEIPLLQGGKIGDFTVAMPLFADPVLTPLARNDKVIRVLEVYYGSMFSRITYEEIEAFVLDKAANFHGDQYRNLNIRYSVHFKDRSKSAGVGGGAAASTSSASANPIAGTAAILPGMTQGMADPVFVVTFYSVVPGIEVPAPMIADIKDPVTPKEVSDTLHKYIIDIEVNVHQDPAPEAKVITKVVKVCPVVRHKKLKKKAQSCGDAVQATGKK